MTIRVEGLSHSFIIGKKGQEKEIPVLKDISLSIKKGEIVSVLGRSGSGKSTLLNLISGYIKPTNGRILIHDTDVTNFTEKQWAKFRLDHFGFIFQSFQLIQSLTTYENIELPLTLKGIDENERRERIIQMLERVGLDKHADHFPNELSGGQQQRVSIARALVLNPSIILADEPTGSLDVETEEDVLSLIQELNIERDITFFIITHDKEVASISDRQYELEQGVIKEGRVLVEI
ncbi:ABC transporter ATP-binding protein [Bacillus alkalicellulosilyticus]|uniref:ABC transporter ATP-binding protein n=1 Tax=Alkalihalobacterium alkalicellulosilyticum TaxID=1912214 RepID=UPI0009979F9E|nr:ABC transporter ATP-binding protein [Bacillus alkalicellulosilyticus]